MRRIYVYCEGQTEESFVKNMLSEYFYTRDIYLYPIICRTKEGPTHLYRGGVVSYLKVIKEIRRYCYEHSNEIVTSFIDYYGLRDLPQTNYDGEDVYAKIESIEQRMASDVGCANFIPYLSLHEFESLLFSDPNAFAVIDTYVAHQMEVILRSYSDNPELIDNSPETAPSKRIKGLYPRYAKISDGNIIAREITLPTMIAKCRHFSEWLAKLQD